MMNIIFGRLLVVTILISCYNVTLSFHVVHQPSKVIPKVRNNIPFLTTRLKGSTSIYSSSSSTSSRDPGLSYTSVISNPKYDVPGPIGIPSRTEQIEKLQSDDNIYDVLIIGGGVTGVGIAYDAALRKLNVACIERGDFASETSSRSTKLIWAGIKYMATAFATLLSLNLFKDPINTVQEFISEMNMVINCHKERQFMLKKQSHLVKWLPIAVPFNNWIDNPPSLGHPLYGLFPMIAPLVFKFYDGLSMFTCPPSYIMTKNEATKILTQLDNTNLKYCSVFYEGQHNDARTNIAIGMSAASYGANICNYVEMIRFIRENENNNKVIGVVALDRMTGKEFTIRAKKFVLAGGPFTEQILRNNDDSNNESSSKQKQQQPPIKVAAAYGTHIVLPGHYISHDMGILDYNTSDGRFLFIAPWLGHALVGTTDKKDGPAKTLNLPPEDDIQWLLNEFQKYIRPDITVQRSDVLSAWRGWRPLVSSTSENSAGAQHVSRDHVIIEHDNIISIVGGKWTTWREMAQDATDQLINNDKSSLPCRTMDLPLYGYYDGYTKELKNDLIKTYKIDDDIAQHLIDTYGGRSWEVLQCNDGNYEYKRIADGYPYIDVEIIFACREYACTIEDILSRRTRLACLNRDAAINAIPMVANIMEKQLGWSIHVKYEQMNAATKYINTYGGKTPILTTEEINAQTFNVTFV